MRKTIPITDLHRWAGQIVREMTEANEAVVITQRGRVTAVLMPVQRFVEIEEDIARLDELELEQLINGAEEDIAQGRSVAHRKVKARVGRRRALATRPR